MLFIDSNIWCYYFDQSAREHSHVVQYIESIFTKEDIVLNTIVIMEIAHYLIKNLGPMNGKETIEKILTFPFFIDELTYETLREAIHLLSQYSHVGIGGRDATILATMKKLDIKTVVTHDAAFKKIDFINVIDPI